MPDKESLALLTDLYQLTMAYGYWKKKIADREAVFHLNFRRKPFNGSFALAAGLETAIDFITRFRYEASDLAYLSTLKTTDGRPLFESEFIDYLASFAFTCDIDALPEGTAVFPHEPILRVQGPLLQGQLLESPLLNIINFQTLIATKAARVCFASRPDSVVEFGMRRAQGIDGAISASRAAFIGGCDSTSNVIAGKLFGIPVTGTHAHSWIMSFEDEEEAFEAYADIMPCNCVFLVDTYDTIKGVEKAIRVGRKLRKKGCEMVGVRLDSGDLAHLSIEIRKMLDEAGFSAAKIMASNELDEYIISDLKHQGCQVNLWGVGTNLVTGKDQPALDGIYKLSAIKDAEGHWQPKLKLSETMGKMTNPGVLQVRRFYDSGGYVADMVYDIHTSVPQAPQIVDSLDSSKEKSINPATQFCDLLVPILRHGKRVYDFPSLAAIREKGQRELAKFHPAIRRFLYPQPYFSGLERSLYDMKRSMIERIRTGEDR
jgi:nicotinate phosphoribosyltransferase